jgi:hypothetical protein
MGAFMTALTEQRFLGIRSGDRVLCPPREWDPDTAADLHVTDLVEVGPAGTVASWTWVAGPSPAHPLDRPFAFALIRLDGADSALLHAVDAGSIDAMATGMRVAPRWRAERTGHITDVEAFVPGEAPTGGGGEPAAEPVTMMDYDAEITYTIPVTPNEARDAAAVAAGRFLGLACPVCGRVYLGGRGYCPVDAVALGQEHEVDLPQSGTVTNFTIITPVQYPGQTETEPFSRVHVLLDGVDVILGYQPLIEVAVDDVRIGMRVTAMWDTTSGAGAELEGWIPSGEPDVEDADLVNRIC